MNWKNLICWTVVFCWSNLLLAQDGSIEIIKDGRIDNLVKKQGEIIPPDTSPKTDGYRLQLHFDSDKNSVNEARSRFVARFPKVDTYVTYDAPNYFLRVGDFRTRLEAERIKAEVEPEFPTSFIVEGKINLPRIDSDFDFNKKEE